MKKIASIICLLALALPFQGAYADGESAADLKAKVAKLESQLKVDAEAISALRAENRALKKQVRKLKRQQIASSVSADAKQVSEKPEARKAQKRATSAESYESAVNASSRSKVEKIDQSEAERPASSSVWDNMFPF